MAEPAQKKVMQGQDWSGEMGDKWNRHIAQFEGMIAPVGMATVDFAGLRPGEKVLDIGCGGGPTTLEIARRVAPGGRVLGIDISPTLVATARERGAAAGLLNAEFDCLDAASASLRENDYDCLFSRFGVMFFENPVAAFLNMHGMLKPGGRVAFCCWGPPPENPWVANLQGILARHLTLPPPDPTAPGPFAFADIERTRNILQKAGFRDVDFTPWRGAQPFGGEGVDPDGAADFAMQAFFLGEVLADQPQTLRDAVIDEAKALFREHMTEQGVMLDGMAWLVSARA